MVRSGCRRTRGIPRLRGMVRQGTRVVMSIASMVVGVAAFGFSIAGIVVAIVNPVAGRVEEGRSAAGVPFAAVMRGEGELDTAPEKWEPRGKVRICRSWCEKGGNECFDVCEAAMP
jgi:hypothetical protein